MVVNQYTVAPDAGSKDADSSICLIGMVYQSGSWLCQYQTWFPIPIRVLRKCLLWHEVNSVSHDEISCSCEFVCKSVMCDRGVRSSQLAIKKLPCCGIITSRMFCCLRIRTCQIRVAIPSVASAFLPFVAEPPSRNFSTLRNVIADFRKTTHRSRLKHNCRSEDRTDPWYAQEMIVRIRQMYPPLNGLFNGPDLPT